MNDRNGSSLVEIFSSVQGEGMLVGVRQIFIRFHGCQLSCDYCDSRESRNGKAPMNCRVEKRPGFGEFISIPNPVAASCIDAIIGQWMSLFGPAHHSISLTGGEPLLQLASQKELLLMLSRHAPLYLETNGVDHKSLEQCIDQLDHISMDMKLPSTTSDREHWKEHRLFLETAATRNVFVKIVVSDATPADEVCLACDIILSVDGNIPLIIQPLTGPDGRLGICGRSLVTLQETASRIIRNVRVIPQTHKFLGLA